MLKFGIYNKIHVSIIIQGSSTWHTSQLQDLLTMVEAFGMPHFLKL
jgi:hypothetical protein